MIGENLTQFVGKRVVDWEEGSVLKDPAGTAVRIRSAYDDQDKWLDRLSAFLEDPAVGKVEALVIGTWEPEDSSASSQPIVEALVAARDRLSNLKHLFFGDIVSEECEISWISQSDLSPLFDAYPDLEHLTVRGGEGLSFGRPRHAKLRELVVQSGGLRPDVIHEIASAEFPNLEHLELWLGEPNYGGEATVEDLAPLLRGDRFPKLRYLGLKDSVIQDEIAGVVALAPVVQRLEVLDLSMGTLGDEGARALLASPAVAKLKKLDLHHHFISKELLKQLEQLGPELIAGEAEETHEWGGEQHRYIAVSE